MPRDNDACCAEETGARGHQIFTAPVSNTGNTANTAAKLVAANENRHNRAIGPVDLNTLPPAIPLGYELREDGVYHAHAKDGTEEWRRVCSRIEVVARFRDANDKGWGLVVAVVDPDGNRHIEYLPTGAVGGSGTGLAARLMALGLELEPAAWARTALSAYISKAAPAGRVRLLDLSGWWQNRFVLGNTVIGAGPEHLVLRDADADLYTMSGDLEGWQELIGRHVPASSRLVLAVCASLAAPLLPLLNAEGGGFNFRGASTKGKTLTLQVAASLWTRPLTFLLPWTTTLAGLEGACLRHNHGPLCLDEMQQANVKVLSQGAYLVGNGLGTVRATGTGDQRRIARWTVMLLSAGEKPLDEILRASGHGGSLAGQEVRVIDVPADAEVGMGSFETTSTFPDAAALANHLKTETDRQHGAPIRAYLERLIPRLDKVLPMVAAYRQDFVQAAVPAGSDSQVSRVAARFGLVAAAGELAIQLGVLPWEREVAVAAVRRCFDAWLAARGGIQSKEVLSGIKRVRTMLLTHGTSRFEVWPGQEPDQPVAPGAPAGPQFGWRRKNQQGVWEYFATPDGFRELCGTSNLEALKQELIRRGLLFPDGQGKTSKSLTVPGVSKKIRLYHLAGPDAWGDGDD